MSTSSAESESSRWRMRLAEHLGGLYAANPRVAGVVVTGSASRGYADRFSDVEMLVCWNEPPSDCERRAIVSSVSPDHRVLPFDSEWLCWEDEILVGRAAPEAENTGVVVEIVHQLVTDIEKVLSDVLDRYVPNLDKQSLVHALLHGRVIAGRAPVDSWARRAIPYPRRLAVSVVTMQGQIDHFWSWKRSLARGCNLMEVHHQFSEVERQLLSVLQALNAKYYFKFKWLDRVIDEFDIAPEQLRERLALIHTTDVSDAASLLADLVEETYDLVAIHLPEVDVDRLRRIFRWNRTEWETPPPVLYPDHLD